MLERPITFNQGDGSISAGRIDLYHGGAFVQPPSAASGLQGKALNEPGIQGSRSGYFARAVVIGTPHSLVRGGLRGRQDAYVVYFPWDF